MKFIKKEQIIKPIYKHVYKIDIKFMIGDADGYDHEIIYAPADEIYAIERLILFLDRCDKQFPHGRGGGDEYSYSRVEGFKEFCVDHTEELSFEWPYEPNDYGYQQSYDMFTITYIDKNQKEYKVEIKR